MDNNDVKKIAVDRVPQIPKNEKDISFYHDEISKRISQYNQSKIQGILYVGTPKPFGDEYSPRVEEKTNEPVFVPVNYETEEIIEEPVANEEFLYEEAPILDAIKEVTEEKNPQEIESEPVAENKEDAFLGFFEEFSRHDEVIPANASLDYVEIPEKKEKLTVTRVSIIKPKAEKKEEPGKKKKDEDEGFPNEVRTLFDNDDDFRVDTLEDITDLNFEKEEKIVKKFPIAAKVSQEESKIKRLRVAKIEKDPEIKSKAPAPLPIKRKKKYILPSLDLLNNVPTQVVNDSDSMNSEAKENAEKLTNTLKNFGIGVTVTGITRGPTVTRFEFKPDEGIKISRIVSLTDDIALSLAASAVRMEAPIPGKPAIGIEIPNKKSDIVYIRDVLSSTDYKAAKSRLSVAIGKDIDGKTVICDIARMPHLLIAGSTGSGKSVCINTMIMGILYSATPDEVKFIMIDPKVVELGIYNNIPHLLIPVVTEPKKASAALAWAVMDVERRYKLFAENNVRDLASYNRLIDEKEEMAGQQKIPQIVIIIDELADLMMVCSQDVEKSIIRLAQKARAAGVHLVIATQRPSVDVITGIIKANIPSRVAFAVASQFDSRTILDTNGAEKLLGRGDMLYHPLGCTKSARLQCAFVSDEEVEKVVEFIKENNGVPEFDENVTNAIDQAVQQNQKDKSKDGEPVDNDDTDKDMEYILEAAEIAFSQGALSTSSIQRRLKLGYSRAARIVDSLEEMGLLSQSEGSKPRQVLLTKEEWEEKLGN